MIVLGCDPGFASLGLATVDIGPTSERLVDCWVVRTEPSAKKRDTRQSEDLARRARELAAHLERAVVAHQPAVVCAETMSWPRDMKAATRVALAWGALCAVLERHGIPLVQASPQEIKKTLCGRKGASKGDIALAVERRFPDVTWPSQATLQEHAADAIAVVLACLQAETVRLARRLDGPRSYDQGVDPVLGDRLRPMHAGRDMSGADGT